MEVLFFWVWALKQAVRLCGDWVLWFLGLVHCRIGSSEMRHFSVQRCKPVHCRIGSSENEAVDVALVSTVHCRIGSSETHYDHRAPV